MFKYLLILIILGVVVAVGLGAGQLGISPEVFAAQKAWIEIVSPAISEIDENGEIIRELQSGDELVAGARLRGGAGSFANIHFPDGSVARIDGETSIILRDSEFDRKSGKLVARLELVAGRIWCKIFSLATPDSAWEVLTPTAVAVVRGTAFGVEYANGKASIVGAENTVEVIPVDSETQELIKEAAVLVVADDVLEVTKELVREAKRDAKILARRVEHASEAAAAAAISGAVIKDIRSKDWVKRARGADDDFDEKVKEIREAVKEDVKEIRRELQKEAKRARKEIKEKLKAAREKAEDLQDELEDKRDEIKSGGVNRLQGVVDRLSVAAVKFSATIENINPEKFEEKLEQLRDDAAKIIEQEKATFQELETKVSSVLIAPVVESAPTVQSVQTIQEPVSADTPASREANILPSIGL
jgi:DNA repair exonuclease SbcCD ATPase subunit